MTVDFTEGKKFYEAYTSKKCDRFEAEELLNGLSVDITFSGV